MIYTDVISYAVIGLSHLYLIEKVLMHQPNNKRSISVQQATSRLLFELYKYGPLRLVKEAGHTDLIGRQSKLCCLSDPYMEAISGMQRNELIRESRNSADDPLFSLTDRGYLVAFLVRSRSTTNYDCECSDCEDGIDKVLSEMRNSGGLKLITTDDCEFPHLDGGQAHMCLEDDSFLDAILRLERLGLVKLQEDMSFKLTKKGLFSAHFTLSTSSKARALRASLN